MCKKIRFLRLLDGHHVLVFDDFGLTIAIIWRQNLQRPIRIDFQEAFKTNIFSTHRSCRRFSIMVMIVFFIE